MHKGPVVLATTGPIIGCGGSEDDLRMFATAWRRLESARITGPALGADFLAAPVATFDLVPSG
jgi:hypothetical protein